MFSKTKAGQRNVIERIRERVAAIRKRASQRELRGEVRRGASFESLEARHVMAFDTPILNFAGQGFSGVQPPDTSGDVGINHYIQAINSAAGTGVSIYDKTNGAVQAQFLLSSLATTPGCQTGLGDPIVLYDQPADRWLITEFSGTTDALCAYVSQTPDPTNGQWFQYEFATPEFPDYPKWGVWPDAYYVSTNESAPAVYAFDRTNMLAGLTPRPSQRFAGPPLAGFGFQAYTPADLDGATLPPAGQPGYFMRHRDDEAHNVGANDTTQDFLELWEYRVDFNTPANSGFTQVATIATSEFDSDLCGLFTFSCVPQPGGPGLDPLREVVMNRLQYRNFGTYETLVGNLATDVDGTDHAGVRWFELRRTGAGPWTLNQEGTHTLDADSRWMGAISMDGDGNIALGYSVSGTATFPSLRYAGRLANDPLGSLPQGEYRIIDGSGSQAGIRWGDYASMSVDPVDDHTFWFTSEYALANGNWATQIASFAFQSVVPPPPTVVIDGPRLIGVQPTPDTLYGPATDTTLNVAPRELSVRFDAKFDIDPATLDGIKLYRTGLDDKFEVANAYTDFNTNGAAVVQFDSAVIGLGGNDYYLEFTQRDRGANPIPGITVVGKAVHVELNSNATNPTTAQHLIDAINGDADAALLLTAKLRSGAAATNIGAPAINYSPVNLAAANAATANTSFNTGTTLDVRFVAVTPGQAGNSVALNFTRNAAMALNAPPTISVSGSTVSVVLNGNPSSPTTAQQLVAALNANVAAQAVVHAQIMIGSGATTIGDRTINYSPLRLSGSNDVEVIPAYKALGDTNREVIMRFSETLPDDKYRLEVYGYDNPVHGVTALKSTNSFLFQPTKAGTDRDTVDFDLDLGARVLAVVPQPVTRSGSTLSQARSVVEVYLNEDDLDPALAVNPAFYQLFDVNGGALLLPSSVAYDATQNKATLTFAANLPSTVYHLKIGSSAEPNGTTATAPQVGSLFAGNNYDTTAYLGDSATGSVSNLVNDVDLYRVELSAGATISVTATPGSTLNSYLRLFNAAGAEVANSNSGAGAGASDVLTYVAGAAGTYYAGVSSVGNTAYVAASGANATGGTTTGSYRLAIGATVPLTVNDDNSSFSTATNLGVLGGAGQTIASQIEAQTAILMPPYPGGFDEPGHRDIPVPNDGSSENHIGATGQALVAPDAIGVVSYWFPDVYGEYPVGSPLHNQITDNQKMRAREIFEIYGSLTGTRFVEVSSGGDLAIVTGSTLTVAPAIPPAAIGGIAGATNTGLTVAMMNSALNWGTSEYGGSWFNVALHEIGHSIGLDHAYDQVSVMGSGETSPTGTAGESVYPEPADVIHLQRIMRPDSTDIDLYEFQVDQPGRFTAEINAERSNSQLDAVLRLYRLSPAVAATGTTDLQTGRVVQFGFTAAATGHEGNRLQVTFEALDLGAGALPDVSVVGDVINVRLNTHVGSQTTAAQMVAQINAVAGSLLQVTQTAGLGTTIVADPLREYLPLQLSAGKDITYDEVARNDDYYSDDSALDVQVEQGTYYVGVSSVGNDQYDPSVSDTGFGGTTDGAYQLKLGLTHAPATTLRDKTGVQVDGDADGVQGGDYDFWFQVANEKRVLDIGAGSTFRDALDVLTITNSNGTVRRFEFNSVGGVSGSNLPVAFNAGMTANQVATALANAINVTFAGMASVSGSQITLTGERDVSLSPGLAGITLQGKTVFVDKLGSTTPDGSLSRPFRSIANATTINALANVEPGDVVRILANGGTDGNVTTVADATPYLIGFGGVSNSALADGTSLQVPKNVTVMIDAGAVLKLRQANVDVGSSAQNVDRSGGALQILGVPSAPVYLHSLRDDSVGGDSDPATDPAASDWGGIVFRADSDRYRDAKNIENRGVILNYVGNADIQHGGGSVSVNSVTSAFSPIHIIDARPTISYNVITGNAGEAISANPNSFDDSYGRIGPDIDGNRVFGNSVNGLFVRINTSQGTPIDKLDVPAQFDDTDIVHVVTSTLAINGNPGGSLNGQARLAGRLAIDPGVVLKMSGARFEAERGGAQLIAEGTLYDPIIFTSLSDDRYGAGGTFDTSNNGSNTAPGPGQWAGLLFNAISQGSLDHTVIANAGGSMPIEGSFDRFNAIEADQAKLRITNSILENNDDGLAATNRIGRGTNEAATIFVRGGQPVIVDNIGRNNLGTFVSIDVNSFTATPNPDYGRATGPGGIFSDLGDNQGPLVRLNRLVGNEVNGLKVRGGEVLTETVWDDTDIVHVVQDEIRVLNEHHLGGLRLKSSDEASLVVKLQGGSAGITVDGTPLEINDRIGGSVQVVGSVGHPVVMTSLNDCTVGAGFTPLGDPLYATVAGSCDVSAKAAFADVIIVMDESASMSFAQIFSQQFILDLDAALIASGVGDGTQGFNQFGLVGYGGGPDNGIDHEPPHSHPVGPGGSVWGTSAEYVTAAGGLLQNGAVEDGYDAIQYALDNYSMRSNAAKFIILVSNEDRDIVDASDTFASVQASLISKGVKLHGILEATLQDGAGASAVGIDGVGTAYLADGSGGITTSTGGNVVFASGTTVADYVDLINAVDPTSLTGDIQSINASVATAQSFSVALTTTISAQAGSRAAAGDWRSIQLDKYSNDTNVALVYESENANLQGGDSNRLPDGAQFLGQLAQNRSSGDDVLRLGFEIHGQISHESSSDVDVYSFTGLPGTEAWLDIDQTSPALDTMLELVDAAGNVLARAGGNDDAQSFDPGTLAFPLIKDPLDGGDFYGVNRRDAGMRIVLPGDAGVLTKYFVRVRSTPTPTKVDDLDAGLTRGLYQLQVRLRQIDEQPGSAVQYSDLRYATIGVDVNGLPAHSPFVSESSEDASPNDAFAGAQELGNLLASDRSTINFGGELGDATDVDFYRFTIDYQMIQEIQGASDAGRTWATMFDVDYADGMGRPDTTLAIFDDQFRLVLLSRESNVADDQPAPGQGNDFDDLTRGTTGSLDPFIGSVQMPEGASKTYYLAISSTVRLPRALDLYFQGGATAVNTRLEPIDSIQRIVEDHIGFQGYTSGVGPTDLVPVDPQDTDGILDISDSIALSTKVVPYDLQDVVLYVSTAGGLVIVNPFDGTVIDAIGALGGNNTGDIAFRNDGRLFGYDRAGSANHAGNLTEIDPGTAAETSAVGDNIRDFNAANVDGNGVPNDPVGRLTEANVDALAFQRAGVGTSNVYYSVRVGNHNTTALYGEPIFVGSSRLYSGNTSGVSNSDSRGAGGYVGYIRGAGVTGATTGMAMVGNTLFGVSENGQFYRINQATGAATFVSNLFLPFAGLSPGPKNLYDGAYADYLFAVTTDGTIVAIDSNDGSLQPIFSGGASFATTGIGLAAGVNVTGLALSPLDINLWHPTDRRGDVDVAGHGVNDAFDMSRKPDDVDRDVTGGDDDETYTEGQGGASFYFGFEQFAAFDPNYFRYDGSNGQYGVIPGNDFYQQDLSSNANLANTYNMPGGALGILQTDPFSLQGYSSLDRPVLYYNYWLQSENAEGSLTNQAMRDAARVWISTDGGASWQALATNNQLRDNTPDNELPTVAAHLGTATSQPNQGVQEMYDTANWRQARVDLGAYAGNSDLRLRFAFTTAGTFDQGLPGDDYGDFAHRGRAQNNRFEGFYIDDIIIGFAERGEMVTSAPPDASTYFTLPTPPPDMQPEPSQQQLTGTYQVEIRRGTEYGQQITGTESDILIATQFDTNDRLVQGRTIVAQPGNLLQDGDGFVISDGVTSFEFEYDVGDGVRPLSVPVPFQTSWTADQVAASIAAAINGQAFQVRAWVTPGDDQVHLINAVSVTPPVSLGNLTVTFAASSIVEGSGGGTMLTVTRDANVGVDLTVNLTATLGGYRVNFPTTVFLPAGSASASVPVNPLDDFIASGREAVAVQAVAPAYNSILGTLDVIDNDSPALGISITTAPVNEAAGWNASQAIVTRNTPTDVPLTIFVSSLDGSEVRVAPGAAESRPEVEANDSLLTAQSLETFPWSLSNDPSIDDANGAPVAAFVPHVSVRGTGDGTFDYYSFTVAAGQRVIVDIDGANFDSELFLYDTSGALLSNNDDDGRGADVGRTNGLESFLEYTFTTGGTYVIGVGAYDSFGSVGGMTGAVPVTGDVYTLNVAVTGHAQPDVMPVTFPVGASSVTVLLNAQQDFVVDGTQTATIVAAGSGFVPVQASLQVTDSAVTAALTLAIATTSVVESSTATMTGTVTLSSPAPEDLLVTMVNSDTSELSVPATVVIPAGATQSTFNFTAQNDPTTDGDHLVKITAALAGYTSSFDTVNVTDDPSDPAPTPGSTSIGVNFTGTTLGAGTTYIPPDTMGAVGINHVVEMLNGRYAVYSKATGALVQGMTLDAFWIAAGVSASNTFDSRVVFDPLTNRWFALSEDGVSPENFIYVARSDTADPSGTWKGLKFKINTAGGSQFNDYPTMAIDADAMYVATNNFGNTFTVSIYSIPKTDLLAAIPTVANMTRFENLNSGTYGNSIQPALDFGASDAQATLLSATFSGQLTKAVISNPANPGATLSGSTAIAVPAYSAAPSGDQPGPKANLENVSPRFTGNVMLVNGRLWAAHAVAQAGRSAVRWYEVDEASNTLVQSGTIFDANLDFLDPSIAVNASGTVVIGFTGTGASQFASAMAVVGTTTAGVTTFGTPFVTKAGVSDYFVDYGSGRNRWGDYSATRVDPVDPNRFWTWQQFVDATDVWGVQITEILVGTQQLDLTTQVIGASSVSELSGAGASMVRVSRTTNSGALAVTLTSSDASELTLGGVGTLSVTIPDGAFFVDVALNAVDDSLTDGTQTVVLTATANGFNSVVDTVDVIDTADDQGESITVAVQPPTTLTEGPQTTTVFITRSQSQGVFFGTLITSDATEATSLGSVNFGIPPGQLTTSVTVTSVADGQWDGRQTAIFSVVNAGTGTDLRTYASLNSTVQVLDSQSPVFTSFSLSSPAVFENAGLGAVTATLTLASPVAEDLTVTIVTSDRSEARAPTTVVVPAGSNSVSFPIDVFDETGDDGIRQVRFTATARGFASVSTNLDVVGVGGGGALTVLTYDRLGDQNVERIQGQVVIDSNVISRVSQAGISVDAGPREAGSNLPFPGSAINFPTYNSERLAPGAAITNNLIYSITGAAAGIEVSGDPNTGLVPLAVVPFARVVNNTIFGGNTAAGTGIRVTQNASPTLINNIVANTTVGISIDATSTSTVVGTTLFSGNTSDGTVGSNAIQLPLGAALFVDPALGNFYLASGSNAIDSSLNSLPDRAGFVAVKTDIGLPDSDVVAPRLDVYGQLRSDDSTQDPFPGLGSNIFKDRGAIDRVDITGPYGGLLGPADNDAQKIDLDPTQSVVQLKSGIYSYFDLKLSDGAGLFKAFEGTGIDTQTLVSDAVSMTRDGKALTFGIDYLLGYNATSDILRITPVGGIWNPSSAYVITLNNQDRFIVTTPSGATGVDGTLVQVSDATGNVKTFEYETGFNLTIPKTITLQVPSVGAGPGGVTDGEQFTISDGVDSVTFEFDRNSNTSPNTVPVVFTTNGNQDQVAQALVAAIAGSGLGLAPRNLGFGAVQIGSLPIHTVDLTGSVLTQSGVAGGVQDGETFTYTHGATTVTFEFEDLGTADGVGANHVAIGFRQTDTNAEIGETVAAVLRSSGLGLDLATHLFSGLVHVGGADGDLLDVTDVPTVVVVGTPGVSPSYRFVVPASGAGPAGITDGEIFTIFDGTQTVTFEFDTNNSITLPNTKISLTAGDTQAAVVAAILNVVNGAGLGLTLADLGGGVIELGETPKYLVDVSASPNLGLLGVAGGATPIDFDASFTDVEVASLLIAAINQSVQDGELTNVTARVRSGNTVFVDGATLVTGITNQLLSSIKDAAANSIQQNQYDGETRFTILMPNAVLDYGDAADPRFDTLRENDGARHVVYADDPIYLGARVDTELDGQPSTNADADGLDEDGVTTGGPLGIPFNPNTFDTPITVVAHGNGFLDAWIDWNNDGVFGADEQVFSSFLLHDGVNTAADGLVVHTPPTASIGAVTARYRFSPNGGLLATGLAIGGEIEDYVIQILPGNPPVANGDSYTIGEDGALNVAAKGVLANDTDADAGADPTIALLSVAPSHAAAFVLNADGSFNYVPAPDFYGTDTFVYRAKDSTGLISNFDATVTITVTPVNDPPVNGVPAPQMTNEDVPLTFNSGGGNLLTVADDAGVNPIWVTLIATDGVVTLGATTGLTFIAGTGTNDAIVTIQGTVIDVNAALDGLVFRPTPDFNGATTLTITTNDLGNTGGGVQVDTDVLAINVTAVNDAPVTTTSTFQVTDEDVPLVFNLANSNRITIADDSLAAPIQVTLTSTGGVMTLGALGGLTFTTGDGTTDAAMTFTGTLAAINAALNNLTYAAPLNYNGAGQIVIAVNDQGNTGIGGPLTDLDTIAITVAAVNDPPVNTVPGAQSTAEDTTLTFSSALGRQIAVSDLEAGAGSVQVTLTATNGAVSLNSVAGLLFSDGDGTADPTMTFTGTIATINARLNGMQFRPNNNFDGQATLVITTNDLGATGKGGAQTDVDTVTITVTPVNDAPVNQIPATQTTNEDVALVFSSGGGNLLSISDDSGANLIEVALAATNGTYTLGAFGGLTFSVNDGVGDGATTFRGTLADVNNALNNLSFQPTANFSGTATLRITTNDLGSTGAGGPLSDVDTVTITVNAVNDAPVNSVPGTQVTDDEVPVVFSTANANRISISDVDAGSGSVRVSLTGTNGKITLPNLAGLSFTVGDGVSDGNMSFTGTIAAINTALDGLSFRPDDFFIGTATLAITTNDLGLTGSGGQQTDTDTVTITVNSVNDAPVNTVPATQTTAEDTALVFSTAGGNAISTIDDALTLPIEVRLTAASGSLTLAGTTGLTFVVGDGSADPTMTIRGAYADINTALNGLRFDPTPDFNGATTLTMRTDDLGNSGAGAGSLVATTTVTINVSAVNDAPTNTVPGSQAALEDTLLTLGGANKISVADVDATTLQVTLNVSGGTVNLNGVAGLTFTAGDGVGDSLVTFRGIPSAVNTALDGLTFSPANGTSGTALIVVTSSDLGGTGSGGVLTDSDTVSITVTPVNDAPTYTLPASPTVTEDSSLTFSTGGGNAITVDDDAGTNAVRMTVTATNGTVALGGTTGLTFVLGDGTAAAAMTFSGTLANINAALSGLLFRPTTDFVGTATIVFSTDDLGNTGLGGPLVGTDTLTITVTGVNDAPVNTVPGSQSTPEDVALTFSSGLGNQIAVSDLDAGANPVRVTLTGTNGALTLSTLAGLTFTVGDGTSDGTMTFTGTVGAVNAALNGMTFRSAADYFGAAGLQIVANDLGNSGTGGALGDTDTVTITVTSVNDPPVASPIARSTAEDTPLTISATSLIANDLPGPANESGQTLTLASVTTPSANGGTVTLNAGQVVYTPALNFNGIDTFTYLISDNGTTNGVLEPKSTFGTVTVTVQPQNDPPTAVNDSYTMNEDTSLVRNVFLGVLANDTDPEGSTLTATRLSGPTSGTLNLSSDGSFTYVPPANFFGVATFTYRASDGALNSNAATVTITVNDVNEPPVANDDTAATTQNSPVTISVLANDVDVDGTLAPATVFITSAPTHGSLVVHANGTVDYTPTTGYQGSDAFQYTVRDNVNDVSNPATVSISVGPAPPAWQNQTNPLDVNRDTFVSPIDPLLIINKLNVEGSSTLPVPPPAPVTVFYDVNGDGSLAPIDALLVINHLNEQEGEGEEADDAAFLSAVYSPVAVGGLTVVGGGIYADGSNAAVSLPTQSTTADAFADAALTNVLAEDLYGPRLPDDNFDELIRNRSDESVIDQAFAELWND